MKLGTETDLVRACLNLLRLHGVFAWRQHTQGTFDPVKKVRRTFHGTKGVSDICGVMPPTLRSGANSTNAGRLLVIECKTAAGRLTLDQQVFLQSVESSGGIALVIRDLTELESWLNDQQL